jgi:hypothetical protein
VARKKVIGKLDKAALAHIDGVKSLADQISDEPEMVAFNYYVAAAVEHETSWAKLRDVDHGKLTPAFQDAMKQYDRTSRNLFSAYDHWQYIKRNKIRIPEKEIHEIIADAVRGNMDALGQDELKRIDIHHFAETATKEIMDELRTTGIIVSDFSFGAPPFCPDCMEEVLA